jgi:uncharacterized phage protein (TIGR02220 family)
MSQLKKLQVWISAYELEKGSPPIKLVKLKIEEFLKEEFKNLRFNDKIDFDKLIVYFNRVLKKSSRVISKKAKDNFNQRIKEGYKKEDIVKVIDNSSNDNYHKESNFKYITLEFLSRPNIFERYSSMPHQKPVSEIKDVFVNQ